MTALDPQRLRVAAHELAHYFGYLAANLDIVHVKVWDYGTRAAGNVTTVERDPDNPGEYRAYLVGLLAGREADQLWCARNGLRYSDHTSTEDRSLFKKYRRDEWARGVSDAAFRAQARRLVLVNWRQITRLTPGLAEHGQI